MTTNTEGELIAKTVRQKMTSADPLVGNKRKFLKERRAAVTPYLNNGQYWVFCLNNPVSKDLPKTFKDVEEVHWQLEEGRLRRTPHLQGVVKFRFPKGRSQVRTMAKAWWALMEGTWEQAKAYNTKEETRIAGPWVHTGPPVWKTTSECERAAPQDTTSLPQQDSVSTAKTAPSPHALSAGHAVCGFSILASPEVEEPAGGSSDSFTQ